MNRVFPCLVLEFFVLEEEGGGSNLAAIARTGNR